MIIPTLEIYGKVITVTCSVHGNPKQTQSYNVLETSDGFQFIIYVDNKAEKLEMFSNVYYHVLREYHIACCILEQDTLPYMLGENVLYQGIPQQILSYIPKYTVVDGSYLYLNYKKTKYLNFLNLNGIDKPVIIEDIEVEKTK